MYKPQPFFYYPEMYFTILYYTIFNMILEAKDLEQNVIYSFTIQAHQWPQMEYWETDIKDWSQVGNLRFLPSSFLPPLFPGSLIFQPPGGGEERPWLGLVHN